MKKEKKNVKTEIMLLHTIIKVAMAVLLIIYLLNLYFADHAKNIPMETISSTLEQFSEIVDLNKCNRVDLKRFYQIDEEDTDGYFFYKAASPMAVEEILILKAKQGEKEKLLEEAQRHLESQINIFEGYGTDQMALLKEAIVGSQGDYVYYMCGANALTWRDALMNLL